MRASAIVEISIEVGFRSGFCAIISRCILCAFYGGGEHVATFQPYYDPAAFLLQIITVALRNHFKKHFGRLESFQNG